MADSLDLGHEPEHRAKAIRDELARIIERHGALVFDSNQDIVAAIRSSGSHKTHWLELFRVLRGARRVVVGRSDGLAVDSYSKSLADIASMWRGRADVAVVGDPGLVGLGIPSDSGVYCDPTGAPEIAVTTAVGGTAKLVSITALADTANFPKGSSRDDFWESVCLPLAQYSRNVTIVDPYLFAQLWRGATSEHVGWLLNRLEDALVPGGTVTLYGAAQGGNSGRTLHETAELVRQSWPNSSGRVGNVRVVLVRNGRGKFPHDRHIRFGCGPAIMIGAGFDRLAKPILTDPEGVNWHYRTTAGAVSALNAELRIERELPWDEDFLL